MLFTPPVIFVYTCLPPPVNTLTGGVENYVGGVENFRGASHPPQANLCTRPCIYSMKEGIYSQTPSSKNDPRGTFFFYLDIVLYQDFRNAKKKSKKDLYLPCVHVLHNHWKKYLKYENIFFFNSWNLVYPLNFYLTFLFLINFYFKAQKKNY